MDLVYQLGAPTAAQLREGLSDPPSYSAVRATLATLVRKGKLAVEADGPRNVYRPTTPPSEAARSALERVVTSFFAGRATDAATALLGLADADPAELDALEAAIARAREDGR